MTLLLKLSFILFGAGLLGIVSFTPSPNFSESYNNWLSSLHELASLMIAAELKSNKYEKRAEEYFRHKNKVKQ